MDKKLKQLEREKSNSLKKMKKLEDFLTTKGAVKKARVDLEEKTEKALQDSVRLKQKAQELAHTKCLD